jgi:hypothetical protein
MDRKEQPQALHHLHVVGRSRGPLTVRLALDPAVPCQERESLEVNRRRRRDSR